MENTYLHFTPLERWLQRSEQPMASLFSVMHKFLTKITTIRIESPPEKKNPTSRAARLLKRLLHHWPPTNSMPNHLENKWIENSTTHGTKWLHQGILFITTLEEQRVNPIYISILHHFYNPRTSLIYPQKNSIPFLLKRVSDKVTQALPNCLLPA